MGIEMATGDGKTIYDEMSQGIAKDFKRRMGKANETPGFEGAARKVASVADGISPISLTDTADSLIEGDYGKVAGTWRSGQRVCGREWQQVSHGTPSRRHLMRLVS